MRRRIALLAWLGVAPLHCAAAPVADPCLDAYQADEARIQREFAARPPGREPQAQQQWSRELHAALEDAAMRARRCQEDKRPKPGSAEFQRGVDLERQCTDAASRRVAELDKRYQGRSLAAAEQAARRDEEARIIDERMQCLRQVRR